VIERRGFDADRLIDQALRLASEALGPRQDLSHERNA
jgi:hypothetical protein